MKTLIAGYWAGEFGWALMTWQARLRHLSKEYDRVIIGCEPSMRYLYRDFAHVFIDWYIPIHSRNMWLCNQKLTDMERNWEGDYITPNKRFCLSRDPQEFIPYGSFNSKSKYDILIHDRSTDNLRTGYRNYPFFNEVSSAFKGLKIGCIGSRDGARHIKGTNDLRGLNLGVLADLMVSSKVVVGASSGPMHFASLCGLPHIVFTDNRRQAIGHTNKERYISAWNPFKTTCRVLEDKAWCPEPELVIKEIECILSE